MTGPTKTSSKSPKGPKPSAAPVAAAPAHLAGLSKCAKHLTTSDGRRIDVWELKVPSTAGYLSSWASHFRQHYCTDAEIDELRSGTGLSRAEYLTQLVFPDKSAAPGPSIRAGDFAELLVADYVEYVLRYWVPRDKYAEKATRDESVKGVDILGFSVSAPQPPAPSDSLLAFEVKAQLSGGGYEGRLQTAINDSSKDYLRCAITLNATKRRLVRSAQHDQAKVVERFQNISDHPYVYRSGAAAVLSDAAYDEVLVQSETEVASHPNAANIELIVIRGKDLMTLVHALYERASNEA